MRISYKGTSSKVFSFLFLSFLLFNQAVARDSGCLIGNNVYTTSSGTTPYPGAPLPNYIGTGIPWSGSITSGCRADIAGLSGECTLNNDAVNRGQNYTTVTYRDCSIDSMVLFALIFASIFVFLSLRRYSC